MIGTHRPGRLGAGAGESGARLGVGAGADVGVGAVVGAGVAVGCGAGAWGCGVSAAVRGAVVGGAVVAYGVGTTPEAAVGVGLAAPITEVAEGIAEGIAAGSALMVAAALAGRSALRLASGPGSASAVPRPPTPDCEQDLAGPGTAVSAPGERRRYVRGVLGPLRLRGRRHDPSPVVWRTHVMRFCGRCGGSWAGCHPNGEGPCDDRGEVC
ncbi:hypothetical protein JHN63_38815 [Streptomyces sp. MBT65]|uniref:hypothetical protein n=1 Tax=Streptomyces sp. MBT65 TaxID=1488395 RepID=UPI00190E0165|nr:hypothetical protein [Streptomyces sp. MBT65]MBK3579647.1 hypothetical protein [Streptomyces sp. MBT65]